MSNSNEEFERYAKAERQFCDEAGPVLDEVIRSVEARAGLHVTELRITVDWANRDDGSIMANCTIVRAHVVDRSDGDGGGYAVRTPDSRIGASSTGQE
jgi:hypothetical protein